MSRLIIVLLLLLTSKFYAQKIEKEIGDYKLTKESFYFSDNGKKKKISKSEFYFDTFGKIIEKVSYGKPHYEKLDLKGKIEQFFYSKNRLDSSKRYVLECFGCGYYLFYSKYSYDENNRILSEKTFRGENDSLFFNTTYFYGPNYSEIHFNSTTFYQKKYDSEGKLIEFNQVFENTKKLRWQYIFDYFDNCKVGKFQTFYDDGNENSKIETECFDAENRIISKEIIAPLKTKLIYSYSENGMLNEIKEYESSSGIDNYKLRRLTKIKVNRKIKSQSKDIIDKINSELIEE